MGVLTKKEFNEWIKRGRSNGATHMISVCDTFDFEDYPVYVMPTEKLDDIKQKYDNVNMQRINEIIEINPIEEEFHRGQLNDTIQELAKNYLGRTITVKELRLYPYLDYVIKNWNSFDHKKVNSEEMEIIYQLEIEGHISLTGGGLELVVTKKFYDYMQRVLAIAYVGNWLC
jgi:hypothetical protein